MAKSKKLSALHNRYLDARDDLQKAQEKYREAALEWKEAYGDVVQQLQDNGYKYGKLDLTDDELQVLVEHGHNVVLPAEEGE